MVSGKICAPEVALAVHRLRAENRTLKQVASYFGHGEEWARRILTNYDESTGEPNFQPGLPGRPKKTTAEQDAKMLELAQSDALKSSSGQIAAAMKEVGLDVSSATIRRRLRDAKKNPTKIRREKKELARKKVAKHILKKEGVPATDTTVRCTIKELQQKNKHLSSRISKKKERKIVKSRIREENAAKQMDTLPTSTPVGSKPSTSTPTDVEMCS